MQVNEIHIVVKMTKATVYLFIYALSYLRGKTILEMGSLCMGHQKHTIHTLPDIQGQLS